MYFMGKIIPPLHFDRLSFSKKNKPKMEVFQQKVLTMQRERRIINMNHGFFFNNTLIIPYNIHADLVVVLLIEPTFEIYIW